MRRRHVSWWAVTLALLAALGGCRQQLYSSLSEREANEMIAVLSSRGIAAEKVAADKGDFLLEVERTQFSAAVEALRDHGLPRAKFSSIGEVFKKEGLVTTANAERLRFMYAMSEELSRTLSLIDGVVEARVHPVLPGGDPLTDKVTPASASVFIKHTPDADLRLLGPAIKDLVCASIEGLSYDKVALTFVPATRMAAQQGAAVLAGDGSGKSESSPSTPTGPSTLSTWGIAGAVALMVLGGGLLLLRRDDGAVSAPGPKATAAPRPSAGAVLKRWARSLVGRRSATTRKVAAAPHSAEHAVADQVVPIDRGRRTR